MRTLIAIMTCHGREDYADAQRTTWVPHVPEGADCKFFLGRGATREPKADEVFLDCDDSYQGLPNKVQEIIRWALEHGYDFMLKCDDDVVLKSAEFMSSGFQSQHFTGHTNGDNGAVKVPWGFCYTLSREAMELMSKATLPNNNNDEAWVSYTLYDSKIQLAHRDGYYLYRGKRPMPNPRTLRAPKRDNPPQEPLPPTNVFAYCVYLNWMGFHMTPKETLLKEYHWLYETFVKRTQ